MITREQIIKLAKTSNSRTDMANQLEISVLEICEYINKFVIKNSELRYMPRSQIERLKINASQ
jgi:hypothetical protein